MCFVTAVEGTQKQCRSNTMGRRVLQALGAKTTVAVTRSILQSGVWNSSSLKAMLSFVRQSKKLLKINLKHLKNYNLEPNCKPV